jgi:hypothetical protein
MKQLMTLIVLPEFAEALSDWLLLHPDVSGFTSAQTSGHGSHHEMSLTEQVAGSRKQRMFWLECNDGQSETLLAALKAAFPSVEMHYWLTPLIASGTVSDYGEI